MDYQIKASTLAGHVTIPPSKSHTLRAILFASLAHGKSTIHHYLSSPDTDAMIQACTALGAVIDKQASILTIIGTAGQPRTPSNVIDAGNSGQVLRFIAAISALTAGYTIITGDDSIRNNRPIQPLLDGLAGLNVFAVSSKGNGRAPIIIKGPLCPGKTRLNGEDSQPVSGLLMACAFAKGRSEIIVENAGERPWVKLTLDWFKRLGIAYHNDNESRYVIEGHAVYNGFNYVVPGDFSSAAFPLIAALITRSEITLHHLDMNDAQGDKAIIPILQAMGAQLEIDIDQKTLHAKPVPRFIGQRINVNDLIDAVPILAVMGCFAETETYITGAAIARQKESNRLTAIATELQKMGAHIKVLEDGLIIHPTKLSGTAVTSHHDHRIAMSLAVAALAADNETNVQEIDCVNKSYPNFSEAMQQLGASLKVNQ